MEYRITCDVSFDDVETAKDAGHIIASVLAYIGHNIEVDVEVVDGGEILYCSHNDEQIMGGS